MNRKRVLVVGGYGTVGSVVSELLAKNTRILPVISGRNESKARKLAQKLKAEWRTVDINNEKSIIAALPDINVIINCFGGPFTDAPLHLPKLSVKHGIHYLDVSGSNEYAKRFLTLNKAASKNKTILITALGINPGISGIALMSAKNHFDEMESGRIVFVLGAQFKGISAPALMEMKHMLDVKPLMWDQSQWKKPKGMGYKEYVGKPFNKEIFLSSFLTCDLLAIPGLTGVKELSSWSGSQSTLQGLVMMAGFAFGLAKTEKKAQWLLNLMKKLGKSKQSISEALIKVQVVGIQKGVRQKRIVEMYCDENFATALTPVLICQQIVENKLTHYGAFVPPEIVPSADFMKRLKKYAIHYSETIEKT